MSYRQRRENNEQKKKINKKILQSITLCIDMTETTDRISRKCDWTESYTMSAQHCHVVDKIHTWTQTLFHSNIRTQLLSLIIPNLPDKIWKFSLRWFILFIFILKANKNFTFCNVPLLLNATECARVKKKKNNPESRTGFELIGFFYLTSLDH